MTQIVPISAFTDIIRAQKAVSSLCRGLGFEERASFALLACVSELAHHLFLQAAGNRAITLSVVSLGGRVGLEVAARCGQAESLRGGLGSLETLMDAFEVKPAPGGARVKAVKWGRHAAPSAASAG